MNGVSKDKVSVIYIVLISNISPVYRKTFNIPTASLKSMYAHNDKNKVPITKINYKFEQHPHVP